MARVKLPAGSPAYAHWMPQFYQRKRKRSTQITSIKGDDEQKNSQDLPSAKKKSKLECAEVTSSKANPQALSFLDLPRELRDRIYAYTTAYPRSYLERHVLKNCGPRSFTHRGKPSWFPSALRLVCAQLDREVLDHLFKTCTLWVVPHARVWGASPILLDEVWARLGTCPSRLLEGVRVCRVDVEVEGVNCWARPKKQSLRSYLKSLVSVLKAFVGRMPELRELRIEIDVPFVEKVGGEPRLQWQDHFAGLKVEEYTEPGGLSEAFTKLRMVTQVRLVEVGQVFQYVRRVGRLRTMDWHPRGQECNNREEYTSAVAKK